MEQRRHGLSRTTDDDLHEPADADTTSEEWHAPDQEDFDTDDLSDIDDHFLLPASGFPPEKFTDLELPVVDPDGNLDENALEPSSNLDASGQPFDD